MTWSWAPAGLSVDPGLDTTWSLGTSLITEPTAVAVDDTGVARACGSSAVLVAARRGSGLHLARPFTSLSIEDPELTRAYLRWVLATAGSRRRRPPLMVVVPARCPADVAAAWRDLAASVGARALVVERPVAALAGLGVEVSGTAHMVIDAEKDATEIAVVADGVVVDSIRTPALPDAAESVAGAVHSLLVTVDPDHEVDIADEGIFLVGRAVSDEAVATDLASRIGFEVMLANHPGRVVVDGAQRTMETVRPYLAQLISRRRSFRAAPGASGR